jgi:hypothetical protein
MKTIVECVEDQETFSLTIIPSLLDRWIGQPTPSPPGGRCGLLSAKGGLMMGTKKVGAFSSPRKKAMLIIAPIIRL